MVDFSFALETALVSSLIFSFSSSKIFVLFLTNTFSSEAVSPT
ncbi:hypothetical protein [Methanobrevibacter sp. TMH8]